MMKAADLLDGDHLSDPALHDWARVRLWFGSQSFSLKRINSGPILSLARIPVQMEFSVGTAIASSSLVTSSATA
ncbi:MAG: hypothetical protein WAL68_01305, partial [Candidatus Binatus sp.]